MADKYTCTWIPKSMVWISEKVVMFQTNLYQKLNNDKYIEIMILLNNDIPKYITYKSHTSRADMMKKIFIVHLFLSQNICAKPSQEK